MAEAFLGRVGTFIVLRDEDGLRHAVKLSAILAVSDTDATGSTTVIQLTANRTAIVRRSFEEVLS